MIKYQQNPRHKLLFSRGRPQGAVNASLQAMIAKGLRFMKKKRDCRERWTKVYGLAAGLHQSGAIVLFYAPSQHQTTKRRYHGSRDAAGGPDFLPTRTNTKSAKVR
ncbi:MAG: hypothetical protein ACXW01_06890 [Methylobacter sp.]